eukprot:CAMPEP_0115247554 /NCGR_PEP_ID=MMETSP0270-20121206/41612_1 /TAXON_ID=71861 /ORGANISM="Scrippsiella trochoidea, Strain CCMP3099" /LENGTH=465 /DNA_ID=CAMNT_0002662823 /DNA_START=50 /DNA_END=1447 /DNA_ORIENTATION=-
MASLSRNSFVDIITFTAAVTAAYFAFEYFETENEANVDPSVAKSHLPLTQHFGESGWDVQTKAWMQNTFHVVIGAAITKIILMAVRSRTIALAKWSQKGAQEATEKRLDRLSREKLLQKQESEDMTGVGIKAPAPPLEQHHQQRRQQQQQQSSPKVLQPLERLDTSPKIAKAAEAVASPTKQHRQEQFHAQADKTTSVVQQTSPLQAATSQFEQVQFVRKGSQSAKSQRTADVMRASFLDGLCLELRTASSEWAPAPVIDLKPLPPSVVKKVPKIIKENPPRAGLGDVNQAAQGNAVTANTCQGRQAAQTAAPSPQQASALKTPASTQPKQPLPAQPRDCVSNELSQEIKAPQLIEGTPPGLEPLSVKQPPLGSAAMLTYAPPAKRDTATPVVKGIPAPMHGGFTLGPQPMGLLEPPPGLGPPGLAHPQPHQPGLVFPVVQGVPAPMAADPMLATPGFWPRCPAR